MQTRSELSSNVAQSLPFIGSNQELFHAAARLQADAFKALMRYQIEALAFLKHRCEQDMKLVDSLVASDEHLDTFDVIGNFLQNATSEYAAEAGKVATMNSRLASETARRIRKEADKTMEDMAAKTVA